MNWKDIFPQENRYWETDNGILYCADSLELLPKFPSESVDLIITDPPYFVSRKNRVLKSDLFDVNFNKDFGEWDRQWNSLEEHWEWLTKITKELVRVLKNNCWFYMWNSKQNISFLNINAEEFGLKIKTWFFWVKPNAVPSCFGINYSSAVDLCFVATKKASRIKNIPKHRCDLMNYWIGNSSTTWDFELRGHPNLKPIELTKRFVHLSSNEGEIVLDAFGGGGNILYAATSMGRRWIGIEKEPKYCRIIKEKLNNVDNQFAFDFLTVKPKEDKGELINFEDINEEEEYE